MSRERKRRSEVVAAELREVAGALLRRLRARLDEDEERRLAEAVALLRKMFGE